MRNDDAYSNRDYVPDVEQYLERWPEEARIFREAEAAVGRARLNVAYGDHPREKLDIFHPAGRPTGLIVFIHGGYWRAFDRTDWSHFARGGTEAGWAVAMPSYPLAPEVGIDKITQSAGAAISSAASYVAGPVVLTGHSAGGHLVARMACADAPMDPSVAERVRSIMPISPVTDLRPLIETTMNEDFRLDEATAEAESPALMDKSLDVPIHVWVGGSERPAFIDQARWLHEAWSRSSLTVADDMHHFNVIDPLMDSESDMVRWLTQ